MDRFVARPCGRESVILFLDYDGVLHPDPCLDEKRLFENAQRLAKVLAPFPEVGIVLSTSWRNVRPDHELLDPLPEPLRQRILGRTPKFSQCTGAAARTPYQRHAECEQWLHDQQMQGCLWWALDDRADWFSPYCENLLECDPRYGFDERMSARLASTLELARRHAPQRLDFVLG
jgi:hypothetical protein